MMNAAAAMIVKAIIAIGFDSSAVFNVMSFGLFGFTSSVVSLGLHVVSGVEPKFLPDLLL